MIDREKVIKGLYAHGYRDCRSCPYWGSGENGKSLCTQLAREALTLLKEQKAVEPISIKQERVDEFYGTVSCCPKCDCVWIMGDEDDMHFCPKCGQAVKWSLI